jgi:hypothetical protein
MFDRFDLRWDGDELRLLSGRLVATIERDADRGMYRVRLPDGFRSDRVNHTRARDAAIALALADLNRPLQQAA